MTTPWPEVVERLKSLHDLDLEIQQYTRLIDDAPRRLSGLQADVAAVDAKIKLVEDRTRVLRAQIKLRENELKSAEQKIERLRVQSSEVKTNKEFVAFRSELANYQGDADHLQGEILKIMDVVEQADKKVASLQEERARVEAKVTEAQARIDNDLTDTRRKRDELEAGRAALKEGIAAETLGVYERARRARGQGLARVEGGYCQGCMERLTRNDEMSVQNMSRLVQCPGCNRILVSSG